jgi:hypothetical protein
MVGVQDFLHDLDRIRVRDGDQRALRRNQAIGDQTVKMEMRPGGIVGMRPTFLRWWKSPRMVIGLRFNNQARFLDVSGNLEAEELSKYYLVRTLASSVPRPPRWKKPNCCSRWVTKPQPPPTDRAAPEHRRH